MNNALVSVVITTYQRETSMLKECIDSVCAQTYRPIEIILVDDNRPDTTYKQEVADCAAQYAGLVLLSHERNMGAQRSRNDGIRAAHGEFVAFLDDDDLWLPQKLETQIPAFDDPEVGLVYCRGYQTAGDMNDRSHPYFQYYNPSCTHRSLLAFDDIGTTSQAVIRAACFDKVGLFDEALPARQDYEMWLRVTTAYKAVGVPEFLFVRRMHEQGQISRSPEKAMRGFLIIYEKYKNEYRADRTVRALGFWQMGSHQVMEGTWFRFKYRMLAFLTNPLVIVKRVRGGRESVRI